MTSEAFDKGQWLPSRLSPALLSQCHQISCEPAPPPPLMPTMTTSTRPTYTLHPGTYAKNANSAAPSPNTKTSASTLRIIIVSICTIIPTMIHPPRPHQLPETQSRRYGPARPRRPESPGGAGRLHGLGPGRGAGARGRAALRRPKTWCTLWRLRECFEYSMVHYHMV